MLYILISDAFNKRSFTSFNHACRTCFNEIFNIAKYGGNNIDLKGVTVGLNNEQTIERSYAFFKNSKPFCLPFKMTNAVKLFITEKEFCSGSNFQPWKLQRFLVKAK